MTAGGIFDSAPALALAEARRRTQAAVHAISLHGCDGTTYEGSDRQAFDYAELGNAARSLVLAQDAYDGHLKAVRERWPAG